MTGNIYQELTQAFNAGRLRAILSSGQAVVMHRLAVMSKDGDWILREESEALEYVLGVLEERGAHYRFGAPLDLRWLAGGWSSHFEFREEKLRVRTDFVTRPPRITPTSLQALWVNAEAESKPVPFTDVVTLAELKKTNRERDYAVIGELARLIENPAECLLLSRSARDLIALALEQPDLLHELVSRRPVLKHVHDGRDGLEVALDAERRELIHANERRLQSYMDAAQAWSAAWPRIDAEVSDMPLTEAHATLVAHAEGRLPFQVESAS
ncbi:MAG: hypothetical protein HQ559_05815 [Lentisphaerae bacterium]|nr:hypothetical protein [Lentisphaerota bacterium]